MNKKPWHRFEALAQRLVEGSFYKLFGEQSLVEQMGVQLAEAVESHQTNGRLPEQFTIFVNPDTLQTAVSERGSIKEVEHEFQELINSLAQMMQIELPKGLNVVLFEDSSVAQDVIRVESQKNQVLNQSTQVHKRPFSNEAELEAIKMVDAFLIISGQKHILLDKPIISIGRSLENDVVLDAPTVSRKHAQIRWRLGRFMLYDLSKQGRTIVNGNLISEHVLEPGDVISLSQMKIIYGEEHTRPNVLKKAKEVDNLTRPMDKLDL